MAAAVPPQRVRLHADEHDKATFGNTFRVVLAEDHGPLDDIGWPAVSAEFGFDLDDDVVTMARFNSGAIIGSVFGSTPERDRAVPRPTASPGSAAGT